MNHIRLILLQSRGPGTWGPNGFTLVELMVTLTVASILIAMAGPSFSKLVANQRIKGVATDLYISLSKARSEAVKRNTSITLQATTANQWQNGWNIPDPGSASGKIDDHGPVKGVTIAGSDVTYQSSGRIAATTTPPSFVISAPGTETLYCISIDLSGRPYQKSTTTSC